MSAMKETMDRLRRFIETEPEQFRETVARLDSQDTFSVEGERYKRPLNAALPGDLQEWHGRRNLYCMCNRVPAGSFRWASWRTCVADSGGWLPCTTCCGCCGGKTVTGENLSVI